MRLDTRETLTSLRPSPLPLRERRGSVVFSHLTNRRLISARRLSCFKGANGGCSLSPGERVGVRETSEVSTPTAITNPHLFKDTHEH